MYINTYIRTYILHTCMHTYVRTYIHTYVHTYVHTYIHTYIHSPCDGGNQTVDHLIYACPILWREREKLICKVSKQDNWPVTKSYLVNKFIKHFLEFTNTRDFKKL